MLPTITAFWSRLPLNEALWQRVKAYAGTNEAAALTGIERRHLDKTVREFERAGADLPKEAKARLEAVRIELAQLQQTFSENVLDATAAYERVVRDEERLDGVPDAAKRRAGEKAKERGEEGWLLTLDYPSVEPILKYCRDREVRAGDHGGVRDAMPGRRARQPSASRAHPAAARRDGRDPGLRELPGLRARGPHGRHGPTRDRVRGGPRGSARSPFWARDVEELRAHAASIGITGLEPWDTAFVMEDLRRSRYDIDDETLRPYFPLPHVLKGLFEIARRTFGFRIVERPNDEVWHEDVLYFEIFDESDGVRVGAFYADWFPRAEKRQGAWMNHFITGGPRDEGFAPHLGVICGNFTPPEDGKPALLTHREVETTFHEFGHLLHHCTSRVEIPVPRRHQRRVGLGRAAQPAHGELDLGA